MRVSKIIVRPSKRFLLLINEVYGGPTPAAIALGMIPTTLIRFIEGDTVLSGSTVAALLERTGLDYEDLFEHEEAKPEKEAKR